MEAAGRRHRGRATARHTRAPHRGPHPRPSSTPPRPFDPSEIEALAAKLGGEGGGSGGGGSGGFEDRQQLQSLFRTAYQNAMAQDMERDALAFETEAGILREQIGEKRRRVCELLEMASDDDEGGDEGDGDGDAGAKEVGGETKVDSKRSAAEEAAPEGDPFRAAILLVGRETPGLERAVGRMLGRDRSPASPSSNADAADADETKQQIKRGDGEEPLIVDVVTVNPSETEVVRNGCIYRLACRAPQDDGEEIEIFTRCG